MKYLIAGLGSIGRRHLRNLLALGEKDILLYRTHRGSLPEDELSDLPVEIDLEAALAQKPDAVIVSNPTALHLEVAIPAAQAGCHLLLEKPVSHSMHGIEQLVEAVETGGGHVLVGYQFRFHPGLQRISTYLNEGAIGRPLSVHAHWGEYLPGWHPWEDYRHSYSARAELGGGVILTLSHPLDYLRWLCGEVETLWAFASRASDLEMDVEDTAEIGLKFKNDMIGSLHLDYNQRPPTHRLEVIGTHGTIRWNNADGSVDIFQIDGEEWETHPPKEFMNDEAFERNDMFLAEMEHFQSLVRGDCKSACSLEDGIAALRLGLAALDSSKYGQMIDFSNNIPVG